MGTVVEDYMRDDFSKVTTDTTMMEILQTMFTTGVPVIIVTDANRDIQGIITGTDIISELKANPNSPALHDGVASDVMTERVEPTPKGTLMLDAVEIMYRKRLHTLVITEGYKAIGILTQLGIIEWWLEQYGATGKG